MNDIFGKRNDDLRKGEVSHAQLDRFTERGGNFIDTSVSTV
jgi:aryl-alcohol dehydrogenase-like predicted oxidoreductase